MILFTLTVVGFVAACWIHVIEDRIKVDVGSYNYELYQECYDEPFKL